MNEEIWVKVPIDDFADSYMVSNFGNVYSVFRRRIMCPRNTRGGYLKITLCNGKGFHKTYDIHRLVALAFVSNPSGKPTVNHKDENKKNNRADNLEWATFHEQNVYGTRVQRANANTDRQAAEEKKRQRRSNGRALESQERKG